MIPVAILSIASEDDRAYMTLVYQRHRALMLKIAWQYTTEKADVEDIVSDSCVALINNLEKLRTLDREALRRYIAAAVRSKAVDHCRKLHKSADLLTEAEAIESLPDPESVEKKILLLEEVRQVQSLIRALPKREQEVLRMKYHQGLKHREIALALGVTEDTVTKYVERARRRLKANLY